MVDGEIVTVKTGERGNVAAPPLASILETNVGPRYYITEVDRWRKKKRVNRSDYLPQRKAKRSNIPRARWRFLILSTSPRERFSRAKVLYYERLTL